MGYYHFCQVALGWPSKQLDAKVKSGKDSEWLIPNQIVHTMSMSVAVHDTFGTLLVIICAPSGVKQTPKTFSAAFVYKHDRVPLNNTFTIWTSWIIMTLQGSLQKF